jgi:hypothetical protein
MRTASLRRWHAGLCILTKAVRLIRALCCGTARIAPGFAAHALMLVFCLHAQQFNTTRHDFEITLETQTQIDVVPEDDETQAIPSIQYHVR